jgi:hypothetical protein
MRRGREHDLRRELGEKVSGILAGEQPSNELGPPQ